MTHYWKCHRCRKLAPCVAIRPTCRRCGMPCSRVVPPYVPPIPDPAPAPYEPPVTAASWRDIVQQSLEMQAFVT